MTFHAMYVCMYIYVYICICMYIYVCVSQKKCIHTLAADYSIVCFFFFSFLWGYLKDKVYTMRPATIAELRASEHECT